ncbi:MAG: hypothetical protein KJ067_18240 [Vicinamibacteria bacterium]|nr:hypothetical protein [Vicinamibacteria bacterium]
MSARQTVFLFVAWAAVGAVIYGGGLYAAASEGARPGQVPEANPSCDPECVSAWMETLPDRTRGAYLRFQVADVVHALLGAGLFALGAARLSRAGRSFVLLAPACLAVTELAENLALAALVSGFASRRLAAAAVLLRTCKFVAFATCAAQLVVLAAATAWRRWRHRFLGGE